MTRKTKAERQANREIRKAKRNLRSEKLKKTLELARNTPEPEDDDFLKLPKEKFMLYWPALEAVLDFIATLKITGEKFDMVIYRIIAIGSKMLDGTATDQEGEEFVEKMQYIWNLVRKLATLATILTDDKTDDVIEKIIAIGDWITSIDED